MLNTTNRLANWTTWGVGGLADTILVPSSIKELVLALQASLDQHIFWLGQGSNLLVRDGGIRGTVIATKNLKGISVQDGGIYAEAGALCAHVAKEFAKQGLSGLEFLAGIPGSIGGALKMNAGCFGGQIWNHVEAVQTIDGKGQVRIRPHADFLPNYRKVEGPDGEWFLGTWLCADKKEEPALIFERMQRLIKKRRLLQPIGEKSAGSVFKNPPKSFAGALIEACGLKGKPLGGAKISERHANFIINTGTATAAEIEQLIKLVQEEVMHRFAILLETEVQIVGEAQ